MLVKQPYIVLEKKIICFHSSRVELSTFNRKIPVRVWVGVQNKISCETAIFDNMKFIIVRNIIYGYDKIWATA